jgi:hypothetical protein
VQPISAEHRRIGAVMNWMPTEALVRSLYSGYRVTFKQAAEQGTRSFTTPSGRRKRKGRQLRRDDQDRVRITKAFVEVRSSARSWTM